MRRLEAFDIKQQDNKNSNRNKMQLQIVTDRSAIFRFGKLNLLIKVLHRASQGMSQTPSVTNNIVYVVIDTTLCDHSDHEPGNYVFRACTNLIGALDLAHRLWAGKYSPLQKRVDTIGHPKGAHAVVFRMWNREGVNRKGEQCHERVHQVSVERVWLDGERIEQIPNTTEKK